MIACASFAVADTNTALFVCGVIIGVYASNLD